MSCDTYIFQIACIAVQCGLLPVKSNLLSNVWKICVGNSEFYLTNCFLFLCHQDPSSLCCIMQQSSDGEIPCRTWCMYICHNH